jgi:hypothetical protein
MPLKMIWHKKISGDKFMRARGAIAVLFAAACIVFSQQAAAQYQYPRDDIVVAIGAGGIFGLIDNLSGTSYDGYYHNNGTICTTPQITGALSRFANARTSHYNLTSGSVNTTVALSVWADLRAAQCTFHTIDVAAGCLTGDIPLVGPPNTDFHGLMVCALDVDGFFEVALPVPIQIPYPVTIPTQYVVNLPTIPPMANLSVQLTFARWDGTKWAALPAPSDHRKAWPLSGDIAFTDYIATSVANPSDIVFRQGSYIVGKASATHARTFVPTNSVPKALSESKGLTSFFQNDPYGIAAITIRDSLIAPKKISAPTDERFGLIGGLFPMIVDVTFQAPGLPSTIGVSFVIAGVTVDITGGTPPIKAGIIIDSLKAFEVATGKPLPARTAQEPSISIGMPTINAGAVVLELTDMNTTLEVDAGVSRTISLGAILKQALNQALPHPAFVKPSVTVGLPQCIDMKNARFEALSPCSSYGGTKVGFVSKGGGPGPVTLSVDFSKTKINASPGQIEIDLERVCVPKPHTEC